MHRPSGCPGPRRPSPCHTHPPPAPWRMGGARNTGSMDTNTAGHTPLIWCSEVTVNGPGAQPPRTEACPRPKHVGKQTLMRDRKRQARREGKEGSMTPAKQDGGAAWEPGKGLPRHLPTRSPGPCPSGPHPRPRSSPPLPEPPVWLGPGQLTGVPAGGTAGLALSHPALQRFPAASTSTEWWAAEPRPAQGTEPGRRRGLSAHRTLPMLWPEPRTLSPA